MARLPRYCLPDYPQHVIQRGNNRSAIFGAQADYAFYAECLADAARRYVADVHAYVFMTNHVHLLMTPRYDNSVAKILQSVGRRYVRYFNDSYRRTGTLWEGRYKATLVESNLYLLACSRYIELNPVRARMVMHPGEYGWSSYRSHAFGDVDVLLTDHADYVALGTTPEERQAAYRLLFLNALDGSEIDTIRHATNKAWPLGTSCYKDHVATLLQRRVRPIPLGRPKSTQESGL